MTPSRSCMLPVVRNPHLSYIGIAKVEAFRVKAPLPPALRLAACAKRHSLVAMPRRCQFVSTNSWTMCELSRTPMAPNNRHSRSANMYRSPRSILSRVESADESWRILCRPTSVYSANAYFSCNSSDNAAIDGASFRVASRYEIAVDILNLVYSPKYSGSTA